MPANEQARKMIRVKIGPALSPTCSGPCEHSVPPFRTISPICQAVGDRGKTGLGTFQGPTNIMREKLTFPGWLWQWAFLKLSVMKMSTNQILEIPSVSVVGDEGDRAAELSVYDSKPLEGKITHSQMQDCSPTTPAAHPALPLRGPSL